VERRVDPSTPVHPDFNARRRVNPSVLPDFDAEEVDPSFTRISTWELRSPDFDPMTYLT